MVVRSITVGLAGAAVFAGSASAATSVPAKITSAFSRQASYSVGAATSEDVSCYPKGAAFRCLFYRPVPAHNSVPIPFAVWIRVDGKRVKATIRGGVQIAATADPCLFRVQHLGADLSAGYSPTVNTCASGWAKKISMP